MNYHEFKGVKIPPEGLPVEARNYPAPRWLTDRVVIAVLGSIAIILDSDGEYVGVFKLGDVRLPTKKPRNTLSPEGVPASKFYDGATTTNLAASWADIIKL